VGPQEKGQLGRAGEKAERGREQASGLIGPTREGGQAGLLGRRRVGGRALFFFQSYFVNRIQISFEFFF